jgi:flagellar protein FliS
VTAYAAASPAAYKQQSILTAPPERLVVMLYDGAHRFLSQAAIAMRDGETSRSREKLRRAEAIIDELLCTLDLDAGPIAHNLHGIYVFCKRELTAARVDSDPSKIDWVVEQLAELREAWAQIAGA